MKVLSQYNISRHLLFEENALQRRLSFLNDSQSLWAACFWTQINQQQTEQIHEGSRMQTDVFGLVVETSTRTTIKGTSSIRAFGKVPGQLFFATFGAILFLSSSAPAKAAGIHELHPGHVPAGGGHLQAVGRLPGAKPMELAIGLPLRNKEALTNLLQQIYDPSSSQYHQYLSAEQFAEMFGPTEQQYQSVVDFM